jgi:hypothetical protein
MDQLTDVQERNFPTGCTIQIMGCVFASPDGVRFKAKPLRDLLGEGMEHASD